MIIVTNKETGFTRGRKRLIDLTQWRNIRKLNGKIRMIKSNSTATSEVIPEMSKVEFYVIESLEKS